MKKKIRAIVKRPNEPVGNFITLDNDLHAFQKIVGGYIECVRFLREVTLICNEEGKIHGLPHNIHMMGDTIAGPCIIVGVDGEDFTDCPLSMEGWKLFLKEWGNEL